MAATFASRSSFRTWYLSRRRSYSFSFLLSAASAAVKGSGSLISGSSCSSKTCPKSPPLVHVMMTSSVSVVRNSSRSCSVPSSSGAFNVLSPFTAVDLKPMELMICSSLFSYFPTFFKFCGILLIDWVAVFTVTNFLPIDITVPIVSCPFLGFLISTLSPMSKIHG